MSPKFNRFDQVKFTANLDQKKITFGCVLVAFQTIQGSGWHYVVQAKVVGEAIQLFIKHETELLTPGTPVGPVQTPLVSSKRL